MTQAERFCSCIKKVRKTLKAPRNEEARAIAICVKSMLQTRGRTLRRFRCRPTKGAKKPMLVTQKMKRRRSWRSIN